MANGGGTKISALPPGVALTGAELVPMDQNSDTFSTTTGALAALAGGTPVPNNTIQGNASGGLAVPGALTTLPAALLPAFSGDATSNIGTSVLVVSQASGNFNVAGVQSSGTAPAFVNATLADRKSVV
jgi:hypothetical protein